MKKFDKLNTDAYDSQIALNFHKRIGINVDITHRCPLECLRCQRYTSFTSKGFKVPGEDMPLDRFEKILDKFHHINFCGQVSDPVHHPKFLEILKMCNDREKRISVHHASAGKPESWYPKAYAAAPHARWFFGLDGLPSESHKYRKNQDGEKMFRIMIEATKHLLTPPIWQYIVFSYNENNVEEAVKLIEGVDNIMLRVVHSSRWLGDHDWLKPTNPESSLSLRSN